MVLLLILIFPQKSLASRKAFFIAFGLDPSAVILMPEAASISFSVIFGLDPNIQVKQRSLFFSLDPRVYSSLTLGHEDDREERPLTLGHEDDKRESRLTLGFDDDRKERGRLRSGLMMTMSGASSNMTIKEKTVSII